MKTAETVLARAIRTEPDDLVLELLDGQIVHIPWESCSPVLAAATAMQRSHAELSPSGFGINWPLLDEDLSVRGLLKTAE